jgi:hypothetical protein
MRRISDHAVGVKWIEEMIGIWRLKTREWRCVDIKLMVGGLGPFATTAAGKGIHCRSCGSFGP